MKIQILDPHVVDQIAAGEVVERPAHLVKELIENSLDAGATDLSIEFDQGGRYVKVQDNGSGIGPKDLPLTIERHATSKIKDPKDLWGLTSYGFRGEALASISSVSNLSIISKEKSKKKGYKLKCHFGNVIHPEEAGSEEGTTVIMKDLFQNTPARLKFLKSDSAESTQIKNVIKAMAMSYPQVTFRIRTKGEMLFFWPATESKKERVEQVLDVGELYYGEAELEGLKAHVVVSSPNKTVKTSRNIWTFVQERWVQDRSLQKAVLEGYRSLLMHGEYPVATVWVTSPLDEVDVNIHPTKSQVKFRNASNAFRVVRRAVKAVLEEGPWLEDLKRSSHNVKSYTEEPANSSFNSPEFEKVQFSKREFPLNSVAEKVEKYSVDFLNKDFKKLSQVKRVPVVNSFNKGAKKNSLEPRKEDLNIDISFENKMPHQILPQDHPSSISALQVSSGLSMKSSSLQYTSPKSATGFWSQLDVIGQAHLTYIVAQNSEFLVYVDQHAAHERVMYERLMQDWKDKKIEVQNFLLPVTLKLEEPEVESLVSLSEDLESLGVSVERMGPELLAVSAAPIMIKEKSLSEALRFAATEYLENPGSFSFEEVVRNICATMACHSVIRAGQSLSVEQMNKLLHQMDEFPKSSFCPHGRPVYVEYSFKRLEKDFGRIV